MAFVFEDQPTPQTGKYVFDDEPKTAKPDMPDPHNQYSDMWKAEQDAKLGRSAIVASGYDPEKQGKYNKDAKDMNLHPALAKQATIPTDADALHKKMDEFHKTAGTKTGEFLSDPDNAKVAHDKIPLLQMIENIFHPAPMKHNQKDAEPWSFDKPTESPETVKGRAEGALSAATGFLSWIPGGLSFFDPDANMSLSDRANLAKQIQEKLTYKPSTKKGEEVAGEFAQPFTYLTEKGNQSRDEWYRLADEAQMRGDKKTAEIYRGLGLTAGIGGEALPFLIPLLKEHLNKIVDGGKKMGPLKDRAPETAKAFVDDVTEEHPPIKTPLSTVDEILETSGKTPADLSDETAYWETKFEGDDKVDLPVSDIVMNADHITPEHIDDMSVEGVPSVNEAEALKPKEEAQGEGEEKKAQPEPSGEAGGAKAADIPAKMEALEKKRSKSKGKATGPQNLISFIKNLGFVDLGEFGDKGKTALEAEHGKGKAKNKSFEEGDVKAVARLKGAKTTWDEVAQQMNDGGWTHPDGKEWDGKEVYNMVADGRARNIFTPENADVMIDRQIKGMENEYYDQLAEEEGIDTGAARESVSNSQDRFAEEIRAEGLIETENEEAALKEAEDFFSNLKEKPKGDIQTEIPGTSEAENFDLQNPETEWGKLKPKADMTPSEGLFGNERGAIDLEPAVKMAREALDKIREGNKSSKYGEALRAFFTGARDSRIAGTNQLRDALRKLIPDYRDQEALSLMRDFKNKEDKLRAKRDEYEKSDDPNLKKVIPLIDRALNPTPKMIEADKQMTAYFTERLEEGKKLGIIDSSITPEQYITHLLEPEEAVGKPKGKGGGGGGKIGRNLSFAKKRKYETILDAVENPGVKVKTLNSLDALTIYGDKHATAVATRLLVNELKNTDVGKWGFRNSDKIPREWVELSPGRELFRNRIPYLDEEGKPAIATQNLYVPQKVADALAPIIDPASISNIPGFRAGRLYQFYIKSVELGLSVFHIKALNITAMNNEKMSALIKSHKQDMESPEFKGEELDLIKHGGTTSILGRTIEAHKAAQASTFPTRLEMIRNLPGIKQADQAAQWLTHQTFDVMQRKFKVTGYASQKAAWIAKHPNATPVELTQAKRDIAKEVNGAFGGLHWENMGINKNTLEISRALMLAPDWTFSNVVNAKYAFKGGPAGTAARKFWVKSAVTGCILTQALSLAVSGQLSDHATEVFLGKDKNGEDVYSNMFFAGAPKDATTLFENIRQFGAIEGLAHSIASKLGPLGRTAMELGTNKNWMGKDIVPPGTGFVGGTLKAGAEVASNLAPIPFSVSNVAKMITDPDEKYGAWDYLSIAGGTPPRHLSDIERNIYDVQRQEDKETADQRKINRRITNKKRMGRDLSDAEQESYDKLPDAEKKSIAKDAALSPKEAAFSHLPAIKAVKIWNDANDKDRDLLYDMYQKRIEAHRESLKGDELDKFDNIIEAAEARKL